MKIVVTGSLGNISKPLAIALIAKGHSVTVISSKAERQKEIEAIGAKAAIGTMLDADFLAKTFTGADLVYCMETGNPKNMQNPNFTLTDLIDNIKRIVNNYKEAILKSGVKKVVHLSSIGAHTDKGNGALVFHYHAEQILQSLPEDVIIKFMRPVGFYQNLNAYMDLIKGKGFLGFILALSNYGISGLLSGKRGVILSNLRGDKKNPWVSPIDIATVIAEEMELPFKERKIRYVASEELSPNEIAKILGDAVGKPYLKWGVISDKQLQNAMVKQGMSPSIAASFVEMNKNREIVSEDYFNHRPALGKTKLKDFAIGFAKAYHQQ